MTKVKICGLTRPEDIACVNECRPDYVGFVFYHKSSRLVSEETAKNLHELLYPEIQAVGVFVNEKIDKIVSLCEHNVIDVIQLHGEEDEEYIHALRESVSSPIIKGVRVRSMDDILRAQQLPCDYLLLDTYRKGTYGGSGQTFNLGLIPRLSKPFFLAGGLDAENVKEKIGTIHPYAVDISSGVEGADGWKDPEKIRKFINNVREAKR